MYECFWMDLWGGSPNEISMRFERLKEGKTAGEKAIQGTTQVERSRCSTSRERWQRASGHDGVLINNTTLSGVCENNKEKRRWTRTQKEQSGDRTSKMPWLINSGLIVISQASAVDSGAISVRLGCQFYRAAFPCSSPWRTCGRRDHLYSRKTHALREMFLDMFWNAFMTGMTTLLANNPPLT